MDKSRLDEILAGFTEARIAVIGDFFLDKYLFINRKLDEPSLETELTAYQVTCKRTSPGAAGNVLSNLAALSIGKLFAIGFMGEDGEGWELEQELQARGVDTRRLIKRPDLFTPTYMKPMFLTPEAPVEANRLDIRNRGVLPKDVEDSIIDSLCEAAGNVDAVVAIDQIVERNTGVITDRVRGELARIGKERPGLVLYADSRAHSMEFRNIIVKCNHLEAYRSAHCEAASVPDDESVRESVVELVRRTGRPAFVTCGAKGIYVADGGDVKLVPAIRVEGPVDICGAGDAVTAGIVSALCCGASLEEAALTGNLAASITIRQLGMTGTATREQIADRF